jgi:hypothetical protein
MADIDKQAYEDDAEAIIRDAMEEAGYELMHAGYDDVEKAVRDLMARILKEDE